MTQASLWHNDQQSYEFAELCNALYERELSVLANISANNVSALQGKLKSLPHYIKQTADKMLRVESPLLLDTQNASWSAKQSTKMPLAEQNTEQVWQWYQAINLLPGLIVPIAYQEMIVLDCVDRIDSEGSRFRTNRFGWFAADVDADVHQTSKEFRLLKPNKKVLMAACAGHRWKNGEKTRPVMPSLRELLLSCEINWKNYKKPLPVMF